MQAVISNAAGAAPQANLRSRITAWHGGVISILALGLTANAIAGTFWGVGMYPFLETNHIAAVGLVQAYLLMSLLGASAAISARRAEPFPRIWHWMLIIAHLIPLFSVALFISSTVEMTLGVAMISLGIHGVGISAELVALTRKD